MFPSFREFLESLEIGICCMVAGAWLAKHYGLGVAIAILGVALGMQLVGRIMGEKSMVIILFYSLGLILAIQHGWTTFASLIPGK